MNLNQKIIEIRKLVKVLKKEGKGNRHSYVTEDQIINAISDKMDELGLLLEPNVKNDTMKSYPHTYTNTKGQEKKEIVVTADMNFIWVDAESGETKEIQWGLAGQQADASQAYGSGLTYSNRYFLLKYFQVSTSEQDPDRLALQKLKAEKRDFEVFDNIYVKHDDAMNIVKTAINELYRLLGMRKEDLAEAFKKRTWCNLKDANLEQLLTLERFLRNVNNKSHEWHHLYNINTKAKKVVGIDEKVKYQSSKEVFGKIAMENAPNRNTQLEIIDLYEQVGIDLSDYLNKQ